MKYPSLATTQPPRTDDPQRIKVDDLDLMGDMYIKDNVALKAAIDAGPIIQCEDILLDHIAFEDEETLQAFGITAELLSGLQRKYRSSQGRQASMKEIQHIVERNRAVSDDLCSLEHALQDVSASGFQITFSIRPNTITDENDWGAYEREAWHCYLSFTRKHDNEN